MAGRKTWRRCWMGLATLMGWPHGWFIPYRYAASLPPPGARPAYGAVAALFEQALPDFAAVIGEIESFTPALLAIGGQPAPEPRWDQDWFPRLDAACAYAQVRQRQPRRITEIGSGHSTRFLGRAILDGDLKTDLVAIDPQPRAPLIGLPLEIRLEAFGAGLLEDPALTGLQAGDMLVIDSSHILMPGSDVDLLFNHVLPRLPAGVLVHVHDVFLPGDYPAAWAWRGYNEQLGLIPLLLGGGWKPVFASAYAARHLADPIGRGVLARLPLVPGAVESSLWIEKR